MTATCPVCDAPQAEGLLCHSCTTHIERDLGDVAAIVAELDVTMSRQAKIGASGKSGKGWAREKLPIHVGAIEAADVLANTLTTWARDVHGGGFGPQHPAPAKGAAAVLLFHIDTIRRHPAVVELVDEITDAIRQARRVVDRPADLVYLGQCLMETPDEENRPVTCLAEVYARAGAYEVTCRVCGITHDVLERRKTMLERAGDMLFSVQEAAQMVGAYGNLNIGESTIRGYISKGKLAYHGKVAGVSVIRLGDLLVIVGEQAANPKGRKLQRAS